MSRLGALLCVRWLQRRQGIDRGTRCQPSALAVVIVFAFVTYHTPTSSAHAISYATAIPATCNINQDQSYRHHRRRRVVPEKLATKQAQAASEEHGHSTLKGLSVSIG